MVEIDYKLNEYKWMHGKVKGFRLVLQTTEQLQADSGGKYTTVYYTKAV